MKYLIRSIKYFFYLVIILCLVIAALILFKLVDGNITTMFVNGLDSLWQMAAIIAVFAIIYPRFGFTTRKAYVRGSDEELRDGIMEVMRNHGYKLEKEDGSVLCFIKRSPVSRALKMWEDRITFSREVAGYELEGLARDIPRLVSALESRLGNQD